MHIKEIKYRFIKLIFFISILSFVGCGYKPSSQNARLVTGNFVSVKIIISAIDPQNTVLIKDAVSRAVIESFRAKLTNYANASTRLIITLASVGYSPIQYNSNGYIISYRMRTVLQITMVKNGKTSSYSESGIYDFSIEPNAIISDQIRRVAIKNSAIKAITAFVAQISAIGARGERDDN